MILLALNCSLRILFFAEIAILMPAIDKMTSDSRDNFASKVMIKLKQDIFDWLF